MKVQAELYLMQPRMIRANIVTQIQRSPTSYLSNFLWPWQINFICTIMPVTIVIIAHFLALWDGTARKIVG
jgi:hypothetical protein